MPCQYVKLPNGGYAIVKLSRTPPKKCSVCSAPRADKLCDFPIAEGKTCDSALCNNCAVRVGTDLDYCPKHPNDPGQKCLFD